MNPLLSTPACGERSARILHIVHSLDIGGLERVVLDLAKAFRAKGHETAICCLAGKGKLAEGAESSGIRVYALNRPAGVDFTGPWKVFRLIRRRGYDVIHTHNEAGLLYGVPGAWLAGGRRIVHTEHGKEPGYEQRRAMKAAERLIVRRVDHLVAVSGALRREMISGMGLKPQAVRTVFNGIDHRVFEASPDVKKIREKLGIEPGNFVLGHIARLVPLKNQTFLLKIVRHLIERGHRVKLVIAGSGPMQRELERSCTELGIAPDVLFLGARTDIPALLPAFDLFLLPSLTEGISITLLEAMTGGVASIASDVGGNPEIIQDGVTGRLLPLNDLEEWLNAIEHLIGNREERERLAGSGKIQTMIRFSLESMADQYAGLYGIVQ